MKKLLFVTLSMFVGTTMHAVSWQKIVHDIQPFVPTHAYAIIQAQYNAWSTNSPFKIMHPDIKCIPIVENNEAVVDVYTMNNPRIFMLPQPQEPYSGVDCNAGLAGSSKMRIGLYNCLERMIEQLDEYARLFNFAPGQLSIAVFEGIRDINYQKMLFDNKAAEIALLNPHLTEQEVFEETCTWVSPVINNVPVHSTGGAIDIRLYDNKNNTLVDMGMFDVINGVNDAAPTLYEDIPDNQKFNRMLFLVAATCAGMVNYQFEWWHFSYGDRYASYWKEADATKRVALYGSAQI